MRERLAVMLVTAVLTGLSSACAHAPGLAGLAPNAALDALHHKKPQPAFKQSAASYYSGVSASSTGRTFLGALHKLVAKHVDLGYDDARDLMFGTIDDVKNNNQVTDIYAGRTAYGVKDSKSAFEQGFNTEHSWCQSRGAEGVAKDDLHILFPVDSDANSSRNNHPYGEIELGQTQDMLPDFAGDGLHSLLGQATIGHQTVQVFQPRANVRGDVARAVLYFYTCYGRFDGKPETLDVSDFVLEHDTMLGWSQQDPPDAAEQARNEAIYRYQGNRNPFVDHPDWVGRVGRFLPSK